MHIRVLLKLHWNMRNNEEYCKDGASKQYSLGLQKLWGTSQHFGGPLWGTTHEFRRTLDIKI